MKQTEDERVKTARSNQLRYLWRGCVFFDSRGRKVSHCSIKGLWMTFSAGNTVTYICALLRTSQQCVWDLIKTPPPRLQPCCGAMDRWPTIMALIRIHYSTNRKSIIWWMTHSGGAKVRRARVGTCPTCQTLGHSCALPLVTDLTTVLGPDIAYVIWQPTHLLPRRIALKSDTCAANFAVRAIQGCLATRLMMPTAWR